MHEDLVHYGMPRRSGRYPYGSGKDPYQGAVSFLGEVKRLKDEGLTETEIAGALGMTTTELRSRKTLANNERKAHLSARAAQLKEQGLNNVQIGEKLGLNESSVRGLLKQGVTAKADRTTEVANYLKDFVDENGFVEFGEGVNVQLGISDVNLKTAVQMLKDQGYEVHHEVRVKQLGTKQYTNLRVLTPPGTTRAEVMANLDKIKTPGVVTDVDGNFSLGIKKPTSIDSKRIEVRYGEDGGGDMDGVIQIRRGVPDLDLGRASYVQGRIMVDGTHYLKGMVIYADDLPDGVDIRFNTPKSRTEGGKKTDVMKPIKDDPDNPFGSTIRKQLAYKDKSGNEKLSAVNMVYEEGAWDDWSVSLSSQFLSKQRISLAKQQLGKARQQREDEYQRIMSLDNPVVRKKLLGQFADEADAASYELKAAALPRQSSAVILPLTHLKKNEIYAPNYKDGERVVLVRHPHGGTFEIPELVVNNRSRKSRAIMGQPRDAVGIHPSVAGILSGADFDGDSVLVIPVNDKVKVTTSKPLKGLEGFDTKAAYPGYPGMKVMTDTQMQMGRITNLISDMTLQKASADELARAVRHSMVVIDAEKHKLNYKQSEIDNGIAALRQKYQGSKQGGSATLITRAKSPVYVNERRQRSAKEGGPVDPVTGKKVYVETGRTYESPVYKTRGGVKTDEVLRVETLNRQTKTNKMSEVDDAFELSSGKPMETVYAEYANAMKGLANKARLEQIRTPNVRKNPQAAKDYAPQVESLRAKLQRAQLNKPKERQAQIVANGVVKMKLQANPDMGQDERAKVERLAIQTARARVGSDRAGTRIVPTPDEWEAIQAGAFSNHMLSQIIDNCDMDVVQKYAMPRQGASVSPTQASRIRNMIGNGATYAEVAELMGVSTATIKEVLG